MVAVDTLKAIAANAPEDVPRVHAVIDGSIVPGLPARLRQARCVGWDCLQRGALTPAAAESAAQVFASLDTMDMMDIMERGGD